MTSHSLAHVFTPADIDFIAGLSTGMQSEWRRRKVLAPKSDRGWTRASLDILVSIFVLKRLADAGFPLKEAREAADAAVPFVKGAIAHLIAEASAETGEGLSHSNRIDHSKWAEGVEPSSPAEFTREEKRANYLIFPRPADRSDDDPVHVIALDDVNNVPANLVVWTAMDNRRAAAAILDGIRRLIEKKSGGE